jgi:hypothetical protein
MPRGTNVIRGDDARPHGAVGVVRPHLLKASGPAIERFLLSSARSAASPVSCALVLGIIATVLIAVPIVSAPCGIIAIVHGAKAKRFRDRRGLAVAGFVLGIIAVSLTSLVLLGQMANGG